MRMGSTYLYHTQERWICSLYLRFSTIKSMNSSETFSYTQDSRPTAETWRFSVCYLTWFEYGLLSYRIKSIFEATMHHCTTMGQIWISETTYGLMQQSRYISRENVYTDGWSWILSSLYRWSTYSYYQWLRPTPTSFGYCSTKTKLNRTQSQCQKVIHW